MKTFIYGRQVITYSLEYSARRTLAITVKPDNSVHVRAPLDAQEAKIEQVLRKRAAWILSQQRFFAQFLPRTPARQYVSGETHLYLGRQYRLRIRQDEQKAVKLIGGYIYIHTPHPPDKAQIKQQLDDWYAAHAQQRFQERLDACVQTLIGWEIAVPTLRIRLMAHRWGSCSAKGELTLNINLIRAPRACIEYVIMHELCHLRYPNHSREFYKLLESVLPDWQTRKLKLEKLLS